MKGILIITLMFLSQLAFSQNEIIVEQSACDPNCTDPDQLRERIVSKQIENDTLIVILGKRERCCATFKANFNIENDTIKIKYNNIGEECFCTCFYELAFRIPDIDTDSIQITFNGLQFAQTETKSSEYRTKTDTLENGNILWSKYENEELIYELEDQDSIKVYRQYYKGILQSESKSHQNNSR